MKDDPLLEALQGAIASATGEPFIALSRTAVTGGCIHSALHLEGRAAGKPRAYFVKVNEADRAALFAAEADGLQALSRTACVRTPAVICHGNDDERAWIVLEWLELVPLQAASGASLGDAIARLHAVPQKRFGWERDNFVGASLQRNGWSDDWVSFWQEQRLLVQLRLAARNRLPSRMIDRGERLVADCGAFFTSHRPAPSLLHGDLWGGNGSALEDGTPVVFDPAVYVGDREADVAMTELFGGFPADFLARYRETQPLDDGYPVRRELYNLYHRLNHANLFFGGYVREAELVIERLLAELA